MPTVTVLGAHGQSVSLSYDTAATAAIAAHLAQAINAGVTAGTLLPAVDTDGPPPSVPAGKSGEFVQTQNGPTFLPPGYTAYVDAAQQALVFGSGAAGESILVGSGDLTFIAAAGSGTIAGGGGTDRILIGAGDHGAWNIALGGGNDAVFALGSGNDTIAAGGGENQIALGAGKDVVVSTGQDAIAMGNGAATIDASAARGDLVQGGNGALLFVAGAGNATILGGDGAVTFLGGSGNAVVHGGSDGANLLIAGTGAATLYGAGKGDQLFASGSHGQELVAGAGNETLNAALSSGNDTLAAGSGNATMVGGIGHEVFLFTKGEAGGHDLVMNFTAGDKIDLSGYGPHAVAQALASQTLKDGSVTITLGDHTKVTFSGVTSLSASNFLGGGSGGGDHGHEHGHGGWFGHG
ncbi:MAG: hypothetical protein KGL12_13495 [Rhodospirillales bacterium]|nr:hypothetical protein [Rhodospirillales bacterium]